MGLKFLLDRRDLPSDIKAIIAEGCSEIEELKSKLMHLEKDLSSVRNERSLFLSSSAERVIYHDLDLKVKWLNKVAADSAGKKPNDIIGKHCYEIWHGRKKPCKNCPIILARDTGKIHEAEIQGPDGREVYIRGYPLKNENKEVEGILEVTLEITNQKQAEKSLEQIKLEEERYHAMLTHFLNNDLQKIIWALEVLEREFKTTKDLNTDTLDKIAIIALSSSETIDHVNRIFEVLQTSFKSQLKMINIFKVINQIIDKLKVKGLLKFQIDKQSLDINILGNQYILVLFRKLLEFFVNSTTTRNTVTIKGIESQNDLIISLDDTESIPILKEVSSVLSGDIGEDWTYQGHYTGISLAQVIMKYYEGVLEIHPSKESGNKFLLFFPHSIRDNSE